MAEYGRIPPGVTLDLRPFHAHVDEEKLQHFKDLLKLSPIGPAVFENTNAGRRFGTTREWLVKAKEYWLNDFDWRKHEDRFNSYPQFTAAVTDDEGTTIDLHFLALFSQKSVAIPIIFLHGWPGSFVEFLDLVDILRNRHSPQDLPYHVIVPSLPGYAYSSGPPVDVDYSMGQACKVLNGLMVGLGFGSGYLAQGGDIGSHLCRLLGAHYDTCEGIHINMIAMGDPANKDELEVTALEEEGLARGAEWRDTAFAYAMEHGTRTGTIGLALSASPLALLSWIGEKFLEWTDEDPPLDKILEDVTLYWMTDTLPRCIYPYRGSGDPDERPRISRQSRFSSRSGRQFKFVNKPTGYSYFKHELFPVPRTWAGTIGSLVSFAQHEKGGHFAAMEQPEVLLADVEEWVPKAWKAPSGKL